MLEALADLGSATFTDWLAATGMRKATFARSLQELISLPPKELISLPPEFDPAEVEVRPPVIKGDDGRYRFVSDLVRAAHAEHQQDPAE